MLGFLLFITAALSIYLPRTAVTLQNSDGCEYALSLLTGAVLHPPGYPLYWIFLALLRTFQFSNPYAANSVASAVFQSLTVGFLYLLTKSITKNVIVSGAITIAWMLFEPTVRTATDGEIFSLHHLLAVLFLFSLHKKRISIAAVFFGLACAHQHTIAFWIPYAAAIILSFANQEELALRKLITRFIVPAALVAAALYLSLLVLPSKGGFETFNGPENLTDLVKYFLRWGYGTGSLVVYNEPDAISYLASFIKFALLTSPVLLISLALAVFLPFFRRNYLSFGIALTALLHIWFATKFVLPPPEIEYVEWLMRFYSLIILCAAVFCAHLWSLNTRYAGTVYSALFALLVLIPPLMYLKNSLNGGDARNDKIVEAEIMQTFSELPANAVYIGSVDRLALGTQYLQAQKGIRPDVAVIVAGIFQGPVYRNNILKKLAVPESEYSKITDLKSLAEYLSNSQRYIAGSYHSPIPDGFKPVAKGVTYQWVRETDLISDAAVDRDLLKFCASWPDELKERNQYRPLSLLIADQIFLAPVRDRIPLLRGGALGESYFKALSYAAYGDVERGRSECKAALQRFFAPGMSL
jgi:hypothetical protein